MPGAQFKQSAQTDLLEAWPFIAEENLSTADRLLEQIKPEARTLLLQRLMGRARPELSIDVRIWPTSTPYVLLNVLGEESITVLRVLHHARDVRQFGFDP